MLRYSARYADRSEPGEASGDGGEGGGSERGGETVARADCCGCDGEWECSAPTGSMSTRSRPRALMCPRRASGTNLVDAGVVVLRPWSPQAVMTRTSTVGDAVELSTGGPGGSPVGDGLGMPPRTAAACKAAASAVRAPGVPPMAAEWSMVAAGANRGSGGGSNAGRSTPTIAQRWCLLVTSTIDLLKSDEPAGFV